MSSCGNAEFDRARIRDEILKMVQEGILQSGLYDCDGVRIGQWAQVMLCCPECDQQPSGPDKDTTNRQMDWVAETQEVSVTDTANHKVSTNVLFGVAEPPPVNQNPSPTLFYGRSGDKVLGEPAQWLRVKMEDGSFLKVPVYLDDVVQPPPTTGCVPLKDYDEGTEVAYSLVFLGLVKHGTTFDEFFNTPHVTQTIGVDLDYRRPASVNYARLQQFVEEVSSAHGITDDHYMYSVRTSIGWVSLDALKNFAEASGSGLPLAFEWRIYGRSKYDQNVIDVIYSQTSFGISAEGFVAEVTSECGFQDFVKTQFYATTLFDGRLGDGSDHSGENTATTPFEFYFVKAGDGAIKVSDIAYFMNTALHMPKDTDYTHAYVVAPMGVIDYREGFGSDSDIVSGDKDPDYAPTNLRQPIDFYYSEGIQYPPNGIGTYSLDKTYKTGWQLDKVSQFIQVDDPTDTNVPPRKITKEVQYVVLRLDPALISNSNNSEKQHILMG